MRKLAHRSRLKVVLPPLLVGLGGVALVWFFWQRGQAGDSDSKPTSAGARSGGRVEGELQPWAGEGPRPTSSPASPGAPAGLSVPSTGPAPAAVTVTGRVSSADDGAPVPAVDVIFARDKSEWTATSDLEGAYSIDLGAGTYRVRALGDRVMAINLPPLTVASEAMTYDVTVVQQTVIRGRAVHRDGRAARGAIVVPQTDVKTARELSSRGELGSAEVESDGSFELITMPGNLLLHASDGEASGVVAVKNLQAGEQRRHVHIVLVPNGFIAGVVRGPKGVPVAGATVLASVQIPGTPEYDRVPVSADEEGRFRWQVPRSGHTIVEAAAAGFAQSAPQAFTLDPGEDRDNIELTLLPATHSLAGLVVDERGEALADVEIAQGREGSKARYKRVRTDADGRFEITKLGPGPHRLRARKVGYEQTRVRQITAPATNITITMPPDRAEASSP